MEFLKMARLNFVIRYERCTFDNWFVQFRLHFPQNAALQKKKRQFLTNLQELTINWNISSVDSSNTSSIQQPRKAYNLSFWSFHPQLHKTSKILNFPSAIISSQIFSKQTLDPHASMIQRKHASPVDTHPFSRQPLQKKKKKKNGRERKIHSFIERWPHVPLERVNHPRNSSRKIRVT